MPEYGLDSLYYQKLFNELTEFCFDQTYNPILNDLTAIERYYLWTIKHKNINGVFAFEPNNINSRSTTVLVPRNKLENDELFDIVDAEISPELVDKIKNTNPLPVNFTYCSTPVEYAYCEFHSLV